VMLQNGDAHFSYWQKALLVVYDYVSS
jgi:hypothetical protein